ncbi:hypothetical protein [Chelativorans alearense]|uniref:hypothetical protein n=1 Tax=Chelativorans alearense TaxID=2681495 RepID=UPI0013D013F7|nr:hypothetical protein [Chelativorans alearense]
MGVDKFYRPLMAPGFLNEDGTPYPGEGATANYDATALAADIPTTTLYAVPAGKGGLYRITVVTVYAQEATTSATLPAITFTYVDDDTGEPVTTSIPGDDENMSGSTSEADFTLPVKEGTPIQFSCTGYASSGATPMQYSIHLRLAYLG